MGRALGFVFFFGSPCPALRIIFSTVGLVCLIAFLKAVFFLGSMLQLSSLQDSAVSVTLKLGLRVPGIFKGEQAGV